MRQFCPGVYLTRVPVRFLEWTEREYRGVDREPYVPEPGTEAAKVWDAWWDEYDSHSLMKDIEHALRLQEVFEDEGIAFEVIYTEVTEVPTDPSQYPRGPEKQTHLRKSFQSFGDINDHWSARPRPEGVWLGYDIAWPVPSFHSTLYQPGLPKQDLGLPGILNEHGLIAELPVARVVANASNVMDYGPLPFCVCSVWSIRAR